MSIFPTSTCTRMLGALLVLLVLAPDAPAGDRGAPNWSKKKESPSPQRNDADDGAGGLSVDQVNFERGSAMLNIDGVDGGGNHTRKRYSIGDSTVASYIAAIAEIDGADWDITTTPHVLTVSGAWNSGHGPTGTLLPLNELTVVRVSGTDLHVGDGTTTYVLRFAGATDARRLAIGITAARNMSTCNMASPTPPCAAVVVDLVSRKFALKVVLPDNAVPWCTCPVPGCTCPVPGCTCQ